MSRYRRERPFSHCDFLPPEPAERARAAPPGKNFEFTDAEFEVVDSASMRSDAADNRSSRVKPRQKRVMPMAQTVRIFADKSLAIMIGLFGHLSKAVHR